MKVTTTTIIVLIIAGCTFAAIEREKSASSPSVKMRLPNAVNGIDTSRNTLIRAAGRIEGRTEQVEVRARISEQIGKVHVIEGQWVRKGELLVELDGEQLAHQRQLAEAKLKAAEARLDRVRNGFRDSEIDAGRSRYEALIAELDGASKNLDRAKRLAAENAESQRSVDDHFTRFTTLQRQVSAAKANLETLEAPPRTDDLDAATAEVTAAKSELAISTVNLGTDPDCGPNRRTRP